MGISWGPVKADLIWGTSGAVLLEAAPRFHGPMGTVHLIPKALGLHPMRIFLQWLMTGVVPKDMAGSRALGHIALRAIPSAAAAISLRELERTNSLPVGAEILWQTGVRDVSEYSSGYDVPGYMMVTGATIQVAKGIESSLSALLAE